MACLKIVDKDYKHQYLYLDLGEYKHFADIVDDFHLGNILAPHKNEKRLVRTKKCPAYLISSILRIV
jgi:hypothetical protein